jgi:glycosyltransferase involved in cell wall biosynthesis
LILSLGVSQPRKQQTLLVEAFSELIDAYPDAVLAVVGGVPSEYWDALGVYVQRRGLSGRVRLEDRTPDVTDWYEAADAFICTSDVESMPRTVMEAMCFALPVAATDIYGSGELLDHGVTGLLLRAHDRDEIVRALVQLLQPDPTELKRIGRAGYDFARRSLSADRWAGQVDALLRAMSSQPDADPATLLSEVTSRATPNAR